MPHRPEEIRGIVEDQGAASAFDPPAVEGRELAQRVDEAPASLLVEGGGFLVGADQGLDLGAGTALGEPGDEPEMAFERFNAPCMFLHRSAGFCLSERPRQSTSDSITI